MTSTIGWLDTDETHRRKSLEIIDLFKDQGTVDEIGIGAIRDAIADVLFPFTSVLHTRVKYALFIPWIMRDVGAHGRPVDKAMSDLRWMEVRLIESLVSGYEGETTGVGIIGSQARSKVKRLPSAAYWRSLGGWDLTRWDTSLEGHLRRSRAVGRMNLDDPTSEDPGSGRKTDVTGLDPSLVPADPGFLDRATFDLTCEQRDYLTERIGESTEGSLLSWFCFNDTTTSVDDVAWAWDHPAIEHVPAELQTWLDHGRRFSLAIHGAALVYNLLLSEKSKDDDLADSYRGEIRAWRDELQRERTFSGWDRDEFWQLLSTRNRIQPRTRTFVGMWLNLVDADDDVADSAHARDLVAHREQSIKGSRSRLSNPAALDAWQGRSGLVELEYRWSVVRRMLTDFKNAEAAC